MTQFWPDPPPKCEISHFFFFFEGELPLGGMFLGVKNNSKNSGTKKNIRLFSKILSKMTLLFSKLSHFLEFS